MNCVLCNRSFNDVEKSEHHVIPKSEHNKKYIKKQFTKNQINTKIDVCRDCHNAIHAFIDNKNLVKVYNTIDNLLSHKKLNEFVNWVAKDIKRKFKY